MQRRHFSRPCQVFRNYRAAQNGSAAVEFAVVLVLLTVPILNVYDVASYVYDRMELENAAQSAVQTAWEECAANGKVPATSNCTGLTAAITTAAETTMGTSVGTPTITEDYCCPGTSALDCSDGSVSGYTTTSPAACSSSEGGNAPGDYIFVTVSYSYSPLYPGVSVASLLTTPITRTAYMRLM